MSTVGSGRKKILDIQNLTTVFEGETGIVKAVDDISFSLDHGETLGIVGESGSGKSVTALSIMRLPELTTGRIASGKIMLENDVGEARDLLTLNKEEIRNIRGKEISMIFQDPMTSLNPVYTCGSQVSESMVHHLGISKEEADRKTLEWFNEVRLPRVEEMVKSYPHQLSGGQKQRVMIAMAMSCMPKILIADEPTTALDVTVQKSILEVMKDLQKRYGMSILFITHDLALIKGFADRILVMYRGKIVEQGSSDLLFSDPKHPYTKGLLNCRPSLNDRPKMLLTIESFITPDNKISQEIESPDERVIRHRKIYSSDPILEIRNLETEYFSSVSTRIRKKSKVIKAVDNVSFCVYPGETLGIVGESGCGKTTLGRTILRLIKCKNGNVIYKGQDLQLLSGKQLRQVRKDLQIIFQDPYSSLNPRISVGSAIMEPLLVHGLIDNPRDQEKRARDLFRKVGLEESMFFRFPHEFSGGQRQRICIARALAVHPKLIICDESVSALDVSVQAHILNLLNGLKTEFGFTFLFISHDLSVVRFMSDRVMVMYNGKIEEIGDADTIYKNPGSPYTKKLLESVPGI